MGGTIIIEGIMIVIIMMTNLPEILPAEEEMITIRMEAMEEAPAAMAMDEIIAIILTVKGIQQDIIFIITFIIEQINLLRDRLLNYH